MSKSGYPLGPALAFERQPDLWPADLRALDYVLRTGGRVTVRQLADVTGWSPGDSGQRLAWLWAKGNCVREREGKGWVYGASPSTLQELQRWREAQHELPPFRRTPLLSGNEVPTAPCSQAGEPCEASPKLAEA